MVLKTLYEKVKYGPIGILLRDLYKEFILGDSLCTAADSELKDLSIKLGELARVKKYFKKERAEIESALEKKIKKKEELMEKYDNEEKLIYNIPLIGEYVKFTDSAKFEKTAVEQELLDSLLLELRIFKDMSSEEIFRNVKKEIIKDIKYYLED